LSGFTSSTKPGDAWATARVSSSHRIVAPDVVATAFQSIDAALTLEVEFADGRRVRTSELHAASRLGDWALVKVVTAAVPAVPREDARAVRIGERIAFFGSDKDTRTIGTSDVTGMSPAQGLQRSVSDCATLHRGE